MDLSKWQEVVASWGVETFGGFHLIGLINHLEEEFNDELIPELKSMHTDKKALGDEIADIFILLFSIAEAHGINIEDTVFKKHERNKRRKWEKPDKFGIVRHVK